MRPGQYDSLVLKLFFLYILFSFGGLSYFSFDPPNIISSKSISKACPYKCINLKPNYSCPDKQDIKNQKNSPLFFPKKEPRIDQDSLKKTFNKWA